MSATIPPEMSGDRAEFSANGDRRSQIETALQASETRYQLLAENASDLIAEQTDEGVYRYVSPACRELLGYEPHEMQGRAMREFLHPEDVAALDRTLAAVGNAPERFTSVYRFRHRDGHDVWLEITSQAACAPGDTPCREIVTVARDITQRRAYEAAIVELNEELEQRVSDRTEALQVSNLRQKTLLKNEQTARAIAEKARGDLKLYADIVSTMQIGLYVLQLEDASDDTSLRLIEANAATRHLTGVEPDTLLGCTIAECFPNLIHSNIPHLYADVARSGVTRNLGEVDYADDRLGAGTYTVKAFPLPNACVGVAFDNITERKRSEQLLLDQKQLLEAIATGGELDDVLEAIVTALEAQIPNAMGSLLLFDPDSQTLRRKLTPHVPAEFARALDGLPVGPAGGACGMAIYELSPVIVENFATDPLCRDFVAMAERNGIRACWSYPIISRDRRALGSLAAYSPAPRTPDPHHLQLLSALTQLAGIALEQHQSEQDLARSERLYRTVVNRVREVIFRTDRTGALAFLNPAWQIIVGHPIDTSLGCPIWELVYESDRAACERAFKAIARGEREEVQIEFRMLKPDGSFCWLEMDMQARRGASDRFLGTLGTLFDVTERKQSEATLEARANELVSINTMLLQTTSLLEQRNRELDQFAYVTSHDLKAPLRAIANLSQWLEEDLDEHLDEDTRHQMNLMRGRVLRMEDLINGLLQYSRAGRGLAKLESVSSDDLLHDIIDLVAPDSQVRFELPEEPVMLHVDRLPLQQVLSNLIANAIKHHNRPTADI